LVLNQGEILEAGHPKKLYLNPKHLYTARLLTNCNILTNNQARLCGISSDEEFVVIYPEWASITASWTHKDWTVKQILFKGSHEDIILEQNGVTLRSLNSQRGKYQEGDLVNLKIAKFLEY